jgi:hypothetical protein
MPKRSDWWVLCFNVTNPITADPTMKHSLQKSELDGICNALRCGTKKPRSLHPLHSFNNYYVRTYGSTSPEGNTSLISSVSSISPILHQKTKKYITNSPCAGLALIFWLCCYQDSATATVTVTVTVRCAKGSDFIEGKVKTSVFAPAVRANKTGGRMEMWVPSPNTEREHTITPEYQIHTTEQCTRFVPWLVRGLFYFVPIPLWPDM